MRLQCRNLGRTFRTQRRTIEAVQDLTISCGGREFVCIVGPSGCGKTTLLKMLAGLLEPDAGEINFTETSDGKTPSRALVFQEHGLFPWMTVLRNVSFGLEMTGTSRIESDKRAGEFLERLGLSEFLDSYPHELSVGMQQRVGIARAVLTKPEVLLMDEPFGSLDAQTRLILQEEVLRIWKENRNLVIYVTHDIREAVLLGDRVLVMGGHPGKIKEEVPVPLGRPRELTAHNSPQADEIIRYIWDILEQEVRSNLGVRHG